MTTTTRTPSTITEAEADALLQRIAQLARRMADLNRRLDQIERTTARKTRKQGDPK